MEHSINMFNSKSKYICESSKRRFWRFEVYNGLLSDTVCEKVIKVLHVIRSINIKKSKESRMFTNNLLLDYSRSKVPPTDFEISLKEWLNVIDNDMNDNSIDIPFFVSRDVYLLLNEVGHMSIIQVFKANKHNYSKIAVIENSDNLYKIKSNGIISREDFNSLITTINNYKHNFCCMLCGKRTKSNGILFSTSCKQKYGLNDYQERICNDVYKFYRNK